MDRIPGAPSTATTLFYAHYFPGREHYRLLFGEPCGRLKRVGQGGAVYKICEFAPGARFAVDLRRYNKYGTTWQRVFVCEAQFASARSEYIPCVEPGVRVLLEARGAAQAQLFIAWLLTITSAGTDPVTCPSDLFEAAHFRLQGSRADRTSPRTLSGLI